MKQMKIIFSNEWRYTRVFFFDIEEIISSECSSNTEKWKIEYGFYPTIFGKMIVASVSKRLCYMAFVDDEEEALEVLKTRFNNAIFEDKQNNFHVSVLNAFHSRENKPLKILLKGTEFQLKVWRALLEIPFATLSTYSQIAKKVGTPKAYRAVGTAIGNNPISIFIPCHRVVRVSGDLGGYRWGLHRKKTLLDWEQSFEDMYEKRF